MRARDSLAVLLVLAAGCGRDAEDCNLSLTCPAYADAGPLDAACQVPPSEKPPLAKCGIFAAPGAGGDGSRSAPFGSLQMAIDAAAATGKPVYACAKTFAEPINVPSGVVVYGGLDCEKGWTWAAGQRTRVSPPAAATAAGASEIGARLGAGAGTTILADIDITAPDGVMAGVSSIALLAEDTGAELTRCTLTAGNGADGEPGLQLADDIALNGAEGAKGYDLCGAGATNPGPMGPTQTCGANSSIGGHGGDGGPASGPSLDGGKGGDGEPAYSSTPAAGIGGAGQSTMSCQPGGQGANGTSGDSGEGASGTGTLSMSGYAGADGQDGTDGKPGQGGGGGGGAKGKTALQCPGAAASDRPGATGGSGGSGGCGGSRGGGGKAGGSSIALASISTKRITLGDVALTVGRGGNGGKGGDGQNGGSGGFGQNGGLGFGGTANGCHGGDGGNGGAGGPGGGGQGGHAVGIAYQGTAPKGTPAVSHQSGMPSPGKGGTPGASSNAATGQGADGASADLLQL